MTWFQYGALVQSGAYDATNITGATISSLIAGQPYALVSTGGPWHAPFGNFYDGEVQSGATVSATEYTEGGYSEEDIIAGFKQKKALN